MASHAAHDHDHDHDHDHGNQHNHGHGHGSIGLSITLAVLAGSLLVLALLIRWLTPERAVIGDLLDGVASLLVGIPVLIRAARSLLAGSLHDVTDQVVAVALIAAWSVGDLTAAAVVPLAMVVGHIIEDRSVLGTKEALAALAALTQGKAQKRTSAGSLIEIAADALVPGDTILIAPGDRVPADGLVLSGHSAVDTSPVTGEAVPREVGAQDAVYAGTINQSGSLEVTVTAVAGATTIGQLTALMAEAESAKPPAARLLDRFASAYLPVVLMLGAITLFLTQSMSAAMAVLIASCPCALAIAAPAVAIAALASAARLGILLKGTAFLERLAGCNTVIFDKTGTLTDGAVTVTTVLPSPGHDAQEVQACASRLAAASRHPISRAITIYGATLSADLAESEPTDVEEIPGQGLRGMVAGVLVLLGNARWLAAEGIVVTVAPMDHHGPVVGVARDGQFLGWILLGDCLRPEARETIAALRQAGITRTLLVTGDRRQEAERVAALVGIDDIRAEVLPEGKLATVREELRAGRVPMVVGDGINDALAIRAGAVGIAIGQRASEVAIASADLVLTRNHLSGLADAVELSRRAQHTVTTNIILAMAWIGLGITASSLGLIGPIMAATLHSAGSACVILNSGLLLRWRPQRA